MKRYLPIFLLLSFLQTIFSQSNINNDCGLTNENQEQQLLKLNDLAFQRAYKETWEVYKDRMASNTQNGDRVVATYTLPTVIHIVHDCQPIGDLSDNPDDGWVNFRIDQTNERFRHIQPDAPTYDNPFYGADADIELCLASVDPDGNFTTGIVRHYDPALASGDYQDIGAPLAAAYNWPTSEYYNIYLVQSTNVGGVFIGSSDIVIISVGSFWSGLICHETGHYFGLGHTFSGCTNGDCLLNGDKVCDTPPKASSGMAGGTCETPADNCTTDEDDTSNNNPYRPIAMGGMGNQPDNLDDYMDYTFNCWNAFTVGQVALMHSYINTYRSSQLAAAATKCGTPQIPDNQIAIDDVLFTPDVCEEELNFEITFSNLGTTTTSTISFELNNNGAITTHPWSGSLNTGSTTTASFSTSLPVDGSYDAIISADMVNGQPDGWADDSEFCSQITVLRNLALPYSESLTVCEIPGEISLSSSNDDVFRARTYHQSDLYDCLQCQFQYTGYNSTAQTAELCITPMNVSTMNEPEFSFDYGHIPRYSWSINTMSVISKECDGTETTLWTLSGLSLGTNDPEEYVDDGADGVYPFCDEIEHIVIPLGTEDEVTQLCFRVEGRFYSTIIVDNLVIEDVAPLPVELTHFTGVPSDGANDLRWETSSELNTSHFILERSTDQTKHFENVTSINAENSLNGSSYHFLDKDSKSLNTAITYYRLTAVDFDGSKEIFQLVSITRSSDEIDGWRIIGNPLSVDQKLHLSNPYQRKSMAAIYDLYGRLIANYSLDETIDQHLTLPELSAGIYLLHIYSNKSKEQEVMKFLVR